MCIYLLVFIYPPAQWRPFPVYPTLHRHWCDPGMFKQSAFWWHVFKDRSLHSFMSKNIKDCLIDIINFKRHCHWQLFIETSMGLLVGKNICNKTAMERKQHKFCCGRFLKNAQCNCTMSTLSRINAVTSIWFNMKASFDHFDACSLNYSGKFDLLAFLHSQFLLLVEHFRKPSTLQIQCIREYWPWRRNQKGQNDSSPFKFLHWESKLF